MSARDTRLDCVVGAELKQIVKDSAKRNGRSPSEELRIILAAHYKVDVPDIALGFAALTPKQRREAGKRGANIRHHGTDTP